MARPVATRSARAPPGTRVGSSFIRGAGGATRTSRALPAPTRSSGAASVARTSTAGVRHLFTTPPPPPQSNPSKHPQWRVLARVCGGACQPRALWARSSCHDAVRACVAAGPTYTDTYEGSHLFKTPPFDTATLVYALYCDGGSWSGNAAAPVSAKPNSSAANQTIYYRGRPLLDAREPATAHTSPTSR